MSVSCLLRCTFSFATCRKPHLKYAGFNLFGAMLLLRNMDDIVENRKLPDCIPRGVRRLLILRRTGRGGFIRRCCFFRLRSNELSIAMKKTGHGRADQQKAIFCMFLFHLFNVPTLNFLFFFLSKPILGPFIIIFPHQCHLLNCCGQIAFFYLFWGCHSALCLPCFLQIMSLTIRQQVMFFPSK